MARRKNRKPRPPRVAKAARQRNEPADWQEKHSPTVPVIIGVNGKRTDSGARRRKLDAEFFMDLDNAQVQAAEELRDAYMAIVGEVAVKGANYGERVDRQHRGANAVLPDTDRTTHHAYWVMLCHAQAKPVDIDAVHEVICEGYTCRMVDRARGRGSYMGKWASEHVRRGLNLWDEARPKRKRPQHDSVMEVAR